MSIDTLYHDIDNGLIGPAEREVLSWCDEIDRHVVEVETIGSNYGITFDEEARTRRNIDRNLWNTFGR